MRNKSVMTSQQHFSQVPKADIPRSSFDRSHGYKTTFDSGFLIPFYVDEALPGDTFNLKLTAFARLATPIKPIFDNMFMETFYFSVPVRQIWENWEKFNGEQTNPADSTDFVVPSINMDGSQNIVGSIWDYMGIPTDVSINNINTLHLRAYNHIFNNWFRDQNLVDSAVVRLTDGGDLAGDFALLRRRKRPDYFTSCLPWPQKGDAVTVPVGGLAPVLGLGVRDLPAQFDGVAFDIVQSDGSVDPILFGAGGFQVADAIIMKGQSVNGLPEVFADLGAASGITINALRQSFQVQKILERDARGGSRYPEILKSHFGVTDPAMLVLQRPEFLGGGSTMVNISPTVQSTPSGIVPDITPQGNLAGFGTVTLTNHGFTKSFTEHCVLIGIVNVRADLTYQQGLNRMWSRKTRFDYYWPALSHIGEQAVLNQEIYAGEGLATDTATFGYQERYAEYRYKPSLITGQFRSTYTASLDVWHLSQEFTSLPLLNEFFIQDNPPIDRVIAVQTEPQFLFDAHINLRCARPMPLYGVPGLIDHF